MATMEAKNDLMRLNRRSLRPRNVNKKEITPMEVDASLTNLGQDGAKTKSPPTRVKTSLQPPKDTSIPNGSAVVAMLSPQRQRKKVISTVSSGTTPHGRLTSSSIAKYVITPHTPQEHDAGLILAALARKSNGNDDKALSLTDAKSPYSLTFPELVHKMVMETDATHSNIIHWMHDGEAFFVNAKDKKLGKILQKYFRHGKYGSLQRQLNMYGWKKQIVGKYTGCFYNPEFHRNNKLLQHARIKRRAPPTNRPKKAKKAAPRRPTSKRIGAATLSRKSLVDPDSEDELESASSAGRSDIQKAAEEVAVVQEKRKSVPAQTPVASFTNRRSDCTLMDKMVENNAVPAPRVLPHPSASFPVTSRGISNMTPGNFRDSTINFDSISPSTPMSPFLGRLMRQESNGVMRASSAQRHLGDSPWTQWYQMGSVQWPLAGIEGTNHPGVAPVTTPHTTRVARSFQSTDRGSGSRWAPSPVQVVARATNSSPSPSEVFSSTFGPSSMRPPLASMPPLFSRESSLALAPVALVQRVSSSFYLPFVGLSDTLTSALATSPPKDVSLPATPPMFAEAV